MDDGCRVLVLNVISLNKNGKITIMIRNKKSFILAFIIFKYFFNNI